MFWFLCGAIIGIYCYRHCTNVPDVDSLVFVEELHQKHKFLSNFYAQILAAKSAKKTD